MVEVTSPTTETIDRREKPLAYKKLPSLRAYLIVDQDGMRVERYWPDASGQWWHRPRSQDRRAWYRSPAPRPNRR